MSAQIGSIPVQTVDKSNAMPVVARMKYSREESYASLKGTDYQLRAGAKSRGIREYVREPLLSHQLRIRGRDTEVSQAFDPRR